MCLLIKSINAWKQGQPESRNIEETKILRLFFPLKQKSEHNLTYFYVDILQNFNFQFSVTFAQVTEIRYSFKLTRIYFTDSNLYIKKYWIITMRLEMLPNIIYYFTILTEHVWLRTKDQRQDCPLLGDFMWCKGMLPSANYESRIRTRLS